MVVQGLGVVVQGRPVGTGQSYVVATCQRNRIRDETRYSVMKRVEVRDNTTGCVYKETLLILLLFFFSSFSSIFITTILITCAFVAVIARR